MQLLFSKLLSGMWPHHDAVAKRSSNLYADFKQNLDITKYTTSGQEDRRVENKKTKRNESPVKTNGTTSTSQASGAAANWKNSQEPVKYDQPISQQPVAAPVTVAKAYPDVMCGSHLKTPEDLTGFPTFPSGTKSSLMRNLSRDIWNKYANEKDRYGFSFKQAIFSGCKNTDSGIGVYAGSDDSYEKFADFFDLIIEDYHKHKKTDKHASDMNSSRLNAPPFTEEDAKMIKSTRIRVGRNLDGFPLGPGITNEQRIQIEKNVVQALKSFTGDLAGTYYPLNSMTEA